MENDNKYTLQELKEKLTEKEKVFCHKYIIDWNGAKSARLAGYSEKTSKEIAHSTLTKVHIQQYIDFIKNDFEKEAGISKLKQLNELSKIAYSSISHFHNEWITLKEFEEISEDAKNSIESIETKTDGAEVYKKIKLYPKLTAIAEINKMMGYNEPDKLKVDLPAVPITGMKIE